MKKHFSSLVFLTAVVVSIFFSCKKSEFDNLTVAEHESEWAAPLFHTSVGMEDLLQKTLRDTAAKLLVGPNGELTFYYQGDITEKYASELFKFFKNLPPIPITYPNTSFQFPLEQPSMLHIRKVLLKSGIVKAGGLNLTTDTILVKLYVDEMEKDGHPFLFQFKIPPTGNVVWGTPDSVDVAGYYLHSMNDSVRIHYEAFLPDGSPTQLLAVSLNSFNWEFSYVEGYWGSTTYPLQTDTIPIDIYQFVKGDGKIKFDNPRVTAYILNSFGFPTRAKINLLRVQLKDGTFLPFTGQPITDGINAEFPSLQEVGQTKVTEFYFDKSNSNIDQIFNSQPVALEYDMEGISNPDNNANFIGFITDSSRVRLRVRVELPLRAYAKDFVVEDTLAVDFGGYSTLKTGSIESAEFKLITENQMPVALQTQITFLNGQNQPVDSLFTAGETVFMDAAPVDNDGNVVGKAQNTTFIPMTAERFERIRGAQKAIVRSRFNTSGGGTKPVTALKNQRTDIRMGLKVKLKD